ncbi:MAG: membrane protein insertase YidC [Bacteroidota bacterium]
MARKGLDKNTVIGLVVIFAMIVGYSIFTKPSKEEIETAKRKQDSITTVMKELAIKEAEDNARKDSLKNIAVVSDSLMNVIPIDTIKGEVNDSLQAIIFKDRYGAFSKTAEGIQEFYTIENNLIKLVVAKKGGRIFSAELKEYTRYNGSPLILFDGDSSTFGLSFFSQNQSISTSDLYFEPFEYQQPVVVDGNQPKTLAMRLNTGNDAYLEYKYTVYPDKYMIDFDINIVNMTDVISNNSNYLDLNWSAYIPGQEKGHKYENNYTSIYYKFLDDEVNYLTETSSEKEELPTKVKWIAFKQQFFSSVLIAKESMTNASIEQEMFDETQPYLKHFVADISLPYQGDISESIPFNIYFGPNHFRTLRKQGENLDMERLVPIGWSFFIMHGINRYAVIPVFNFLENYIGSYGLIILILTILLKLILLPLTFKSYMSTAKMRVLKPQIDEIHAKIPKDKTMERQQATMALYKKVGVSPMGGCLPMILQFPILIAMFRFFPASIELRQQGFLWADDLSAYDSIATLPFTVPFGYGDHVSLFTLLMTISTIIYTYLTSKQQVATQSMPGMKVMMYLMPVMFLFFFNNYSSALSYYYLLANLITFLQMYLFKRFVNDEAVLQKLDVSKKKPVKKSKFMERLEQAQKQRMKR